MDKRPDMMLVMSDQHGFLDTGFADSRIDTPNLKRIAAEGMMFERCYCNAPLCVPSRMSFLTGQLPSDLGIFNNDSSLPSDVPAITHELGRLGYETVLIGRMHFKGDDQRHGFDRHLYGDITSQYWGTGGRERTDFGCYAGTTNRLRCTEAVGGGISPVMIYDEHVYTHAAEFLEQRRRELSEKPLFLLVGFYSPHFPFVCREDLYRKYLSRYGEQECRQAAVIPPLPVYEEYTSRCSSERLRNCRAAYCGLAEQLDTYVGALYDCFQKACGEREHLFVYLSDHGEQLGRRGIFGKQTLYEHAIRVPFVAAGTHIPKGVCREPVGLLDVSRTILAQAGDREEDQRWHRGRVLDFSRLRLSGRWVRVQQMLKRKGKRLLAEGAVSGKYKVLRADDRWYVYDLEADADERQNLLESCPSKAQGLINQALEQGCFLEKDTIDRLILQEEILCQRQKRLKAWGQARKPEEWGTIQMMPGTLREPEE